MAQKESESSKRRKPRRQKLSPFLAHLELPGVLTAQTLMGIWSLPTVAGKRKRAPVGPTQAMADSRKPACLSHPLAGRLAPAVSACCLGWRGWLSVVQGEELLF